MIRRRLIAACAAALPVGLAFAALFLTPLGAVFTSAPGDAKGAGRIDASLVTPDLIAATRGENSAAGVEGDQARLINASLPFIPSAIENARPFQIGAASAGDETRALHCLAQAVYYEAGYEPVEGRRAVAQVVLNRLRHPAFAKTVCGVVYEGSTRPGCQFSFTCDGSLARAPSGPAWAAAREVARQALQGKVAASVGHATHYHADYVSPYWAPRLTKLSQIGAHIFYRWPGAWGRPAAFTGRYSGREAGILQETEEAGMVLASATLPLDPTDRRAPEDVGGRLDVAKGWTLSIPDPHQTRSAYANVVGQQIPEQETQRPVVTAGVQTSGVMQ